MSFCGCYFGGVAGLALTSLWEALLDSLGLTRLIEIVTHDIMAYAYIVCIH